MRSTPSSQLPSQHFPALSCMVAAVLWGFFWYPLRLLDEMGVSGLWSTLIIYCSALIFLLPACWRWRAEFLRHKMDYMLIGLFAGWANLAFILAVLEGEVVRVLLLFYLSPIWAILLAFFMSNVFKKGGPFKGSLPIKKFLVTLISGTKAKS